MIRSLAGVAITSALGLIAFFVRGYFQSLHEDIEELGKDIKEIALKVDDVQDHLRDNTIEIAKASSDLRAVWRTLGSTDSDDGAMPS